MKLINIIILMPISFIAMAEKADYKPWIGASLILLDGYSTYYVLNHRKAKEDNPILGEHPTNKQLRWAIGTELVLHYLFNQTKFKNVWNNSIIVIHTYTVINNIYVINVSKSFY